MGRPSKPTKLHVLQGTFRPGRHANRANEPDVQDGVGDPPAWMAGHALEEWRRCADHPVIGQIIRANHRPTFIHFCTLYGRMIEDANGGEAMTASQRQTLNSICIGFGFSPASQTKVSIPVPKPKESPWAKLRESVPKTEKPCATLA